MPSLKTEITEITTGLGALGCDLTVALRDPPPQVINVAAGTWDRLRAAHESGEHTALFTIAWTNGRAFLQAADGLRGRLPIRIEWKGPDRQVEQDPIPADLRIDNVFLVSVKTRSSVLWNRSPSQVFRRVAQSVHWYLETAPHEYQQLYQAAVAHSGISGLPTDASELTREQGLQVARTLGERAWPEPVSHHYQAMATRCSIESARIWSETAKTSSQKERMAWWLLRLAPAPYFLLGDSVRAPLRIRVDTPWDWRQSWDFEALHIVPALGAGQPQVDWTIHARHKRTGETRVAAGYVEIRWSHRRFNGHPEAKVQLRTPHELVPGYTHLT